MGVSRRALTAVAMVLGCAAGGAVRAASMSYGDVGPVSPGMTFQQVTESSLTDAVPLFGTPTPFVTGLKFSPTTFAATVGNNQTDHTDGTLTTTIAGSNTASGWVGIGTVSFSESGVYSSRGPDGEVHAAATLQITITEVDGVAITPIVLPALNASFDQSSAQVDDAAWSLGLDVPLLPSLVQAGFGLTALATKVDVSIENDLTAIGQENDHASISKDDFQLTVAPLGPGTTPVPLPGAAGAGMVMLAGLAARRRRR